MKILAFVYQKAVHVRRNSGSVTANLKNNVVPLRPIPGITQILFPSILIVTDASAPYISSYRKSNLKWFLLPVDIAPCFLGVLVNGDAVGNSDQISNP